MGSALVKILLLLIAIAAFFVADKYISTPSDESVSYDIIEIKKGSIENLVTSQGKIEPKSFVNIGARVSGALEKLHVTPGDDIKKGQLIAEIDAEIFESEVAGNEARLQGLHFQSKEQKATLEQVRRIHKRNETLIESGAISQEVFEDSLTNLKVSEARKESLASQISEAKSTLNANKANLNFTKIYSPMNGTVVTQEAREGETLNASQTTPTIISIANLETMTVRAQVAEADIGKIKKGMEVYFTVLGNQKRSWEGKVEKILPVPEITNNIVLYNVLMTVENKDRVLMTDMSTQMFFVIDRAEDVPLIPTKVLTNRLSDQDEGESKAYRINVYSSGSPREKTIWVGLIDRSNSEIVKGLSPGDKIMAPAITEQPSLNNNTKKSRRSFLRFL